MQKNKRPAPEPSGHSPEQQDEALTRELARLALELARHDRRTPDAGAMKKTKGDLHRLVRKCLQQKKDDVLEEALERAQEEDESAFLLLREAIEDNAQIVVFRREQEPDLEVNAFVVPLFAHTDGGLQPEQCFQDEAAFEALRRSVQDAGLESRDARVVLVSHAYHANEIERIGYSQLHDMVHEACASMTRKKPGEAPAIAASMSGWPEHRFAREDRAVELRFLLGFALKTLDDPFYREPDNEAAADRYFDARAQRFRQWAQQVAPVVQRCLVTDGREMHIDFLYQDLFYGGKETGLAEQQTLRMMAELRQSLQARGIAPEQAKAVVGPAEAEGETVLRVALYAADDAVIASWDRPLGAARDLAGEAADACDALTTIGVRSLALARKFDGNGQPLGVRPHGN